MIDARFSPSNFFVAPGFPNLVLDIEEWRDCLPSFREDKYDNPIEHLLEFYKLVRQLGIYHQDVLMKMIMYSLEGDAHEWYKSLPPSSISSLKEFHTTFHNQCKCYFPNEIIF